MLESVFDLYHFVVFKLGVGPASHACNYFSTSVFHSWEHHYWEHSWEPVASSLIFLYHLLNSSFPWLLE